MSRIPSQQDQAIIIIGGGLAGLFCALKLAPLPVTIISQASLGQAASSSWAQGGIAAALSKGDHWQSHLDDTIKAGDGLVDAAMAALMVKEANARIEDLLHYGVPFDRTLEGALSLNREAAHSQKRILHIRGDQAGKAIMHALSEAVAKTPSITICDHMRVDSLITHHGAISGVTMRSMRYESEDAISLNASTVILTTGGIGGLYAVTTNPLEAIGSGLALAAKAGAILADCEFVQFHPTALSLPPSDQDDQKPAILLTEALRGEGATIIDQDNTPLMQGAHPDGDLASRDIVARHVHQAIYSGRNAFLDLRHFEQARLEKHFPTLIKAAKIAGLNPTQQPLPIAPAAHYHMGGIVTDAYGRSSINGLFAAGEVACTGVHGANRLASNSLLEAVIFAARIADHIKTLIHKPAKAEPLITHDHHDKASLTGRHQMQLDETDRHLMQNLRHIMSQYLGVERSQQGLIKALKFIQNYEHQSFHLTIRHAFLVAKLVTISALSRCESRGGHFRLDYPKKSSDKAKRFFITKAKADNQAQNWLNQ